MRGLAGLAGAAYHSGFASIQIAPAGYLAVDFFFALSGFVIALNYSDRLAGAMSVREFLVRRMIRLYPICLVGHACGIARNLAMLALGNPNALRGLEFVFPVLFGALMLPVPLDMRNIFPLNVPAWSLFLELAINVVFAVGLFRARTVMLGVIMAVSATVLAFGVGAPDYFNLGYSWETLPFGFARVALSFSIGIVLYRYLSGKAPVPSSIIFVPVAILLGILVVPLAESARAVWELFCVVVVFPVILGMGIRWDAPRLAVPAFDFLGGISYAVYAIHGPMIFFVNGFAERAGLGAAQSLALYLASVIAAGWFVTALIDAPARRAINHWRAGRNPQVRSSRFGSGE